MSTNPTPTPATKITLDTLYNALDWSQVNQGHEKWEKDNPGSHFVPLPEKKELRINFLSEALRGLIEIEMPSEYMRERSFNMAMRKWDPDEVKANARGLLRAAGVWDQIVDFVKKHKLDQ